jgi:hypothetical protein
MLRAVVLALGALALLGGLTGLLLGHDPGALVAVIFGLLIITGTIFERHYNAPTTTIDPGFAPTGEIFIDPVTNSRTETWFNPATGERRYITQPR